MDKSTILSNHIEFKKTSVKSRKKILEIERYIGKFINSAKKPLDKFTEEDLVKFINSLDYSTRTLNDVKVYLKSFIKWFFVDYSSRFRNLDKICRTQTPSKTYQPEQMIKEEDLKKLIEEENDMLYKTYWGVMFFGGFRPSEAAKLKWNEVYFEPEGVTIKLHATKTNRDYYKSLPKEIEHLLKEWKRRNDSIYIFPSPSNINEPISTNTIWYKLKRLSKRVLKKELTPYILRHSIATILYQDDDRKDDDTANQLGHSKSMKNTYLNLNEEKLKARARNIWKRPKPLTPEERTELEQMRKKILEMEKQMELMSHSFKLDVKKLKQQILQEIGELSFVEGKLKKKSP